MKRTMLLLCLALVALSVSSLPAMADVVKIEGVSLTINNSKVTVGGSGTSQTIPVADGVIFNYTLNPPGKLKNNDVFTLTYRLVDSTNHPLLQQAVEGTVLRDSTQTVINWNPIPTLTAAGLTPMKLELEQTHITGNKGSIKANITVPEPTTLALLFPGIAFLGSLRRRLFV